MRVQFSMHIRKIFDVHCRAIGLWLLNLISILKRQDFVQKKELFTTSYLAGQKYSIASLWNGHFKKILSRSLWMPDSYHWQISIWIPDCEANSRIVEHFQTKQIPLSEISSNCECVISFFNIEQQPFWENISFLSRK